MQSSFPVQNEWPGIGAIENSPVPLTGGPPEVVGEPIPAMPKSLTEAGLHKNDVYPLILKFIFLHGNQFGSKISQQLKMPFHLIEPLLQELKSEQLLSPKNSTGVGDFEYELTPKGVEQTKLYLSRSSYCGAAPVALADYKAAVKRQSLRNLKPGFADVKKAYEDLVVSDLMLSQIGQALSSGRSIFLFGSPGNGKTSIALRAMKAVSPYIWIPRALTVGGEVIRLYDPIVHQAVALPRSGSVTRDFEVDDRWVRIKRPTIVVGGELELKHLDATCNRVTGIIEAPIHVKSNCGCLVVDDFGRQQVSPTELLNRWIVPMESGYDYINLPSGRQVSLPFEQLLVFSTNLDPQQLCDEAFLRRIPYKIEVFDPSEKQFRELFELKLDELGFQAQEGVVEQIIEYHYKRVGRKFRFSHVGDLLSIAKDFCEFHRQPLMLKKEIAEIAILNYFSGMPGAIGI